MEGLLTDVLTQDERLNVFDFHSQISFTVFGCPPRIH